MTGYGVLLAAAKRSPAHVLASAAGLGVGISLALAEAVVSLPLARHSRIDLPPWSLQARPAGLYTERERERELSSVVNMCCNDSAFPRRRARANSKHLTIFSHNIANCV